MSCANALAVTPDLDPNRLRLQRSGRRQPTTSGGLPRLREHTHRRAVPHLDGARREMYNGRPPRTDPHGSRPTRSTMGAASSRAASLRRPSLPRTAHVELDRRCTLVAGRLAAAQGIDPALDAVSCVGDRPFFAANRTPPPPPHAAEHARGHVSALEFSTHLGSLLGWDLQEAGVHPSTRAASGSTRCDPVHGPAALDNTNFGAGQTCAELGRVGSSAIAPGRVAAPAAGQPVALF